MYSRRLRALAAREAFFSSWDSAIMSRCPSYTVLCSGATVACGPAGVNETGLTTPGPSAMLPYAFRAVAQGLARAVRDGEVGGSNPLSPTFRAVIQE